SGKRLLKSNGFGLCFVPPPGSWRAGAESRLAIGTRKRVPIGDPGRVAIPHRNPIMAGAQDAVERPASGVELLARFRRGDRLDQRVDPRIGDAGEIARTVLGGG